MTLISCCNQALQLAASLLSDFLAAARHKNTHLYTVPVPAGRLTSIYFMSLGHARPLAVRLRYWLHVTAALCLAVFCLTLL